MGLNLVKKAGKDSLEDYFRPFREQVIGINEYFESPFGKKRILYADWVSSGRLYNPIEEKLKNEFGPYVGNTHTETSVTGTMMTVAYHIARETIKRHVNASSTDIIITSGSGMTGVVNKFQRILGMKIPDKLKPYVKIDEESRPVVFITHMEHHSNHTSWLETIADVECIAPTDEGLVDFNSLESLIKKYENRKTKIASVSACSNVTGIRNPIHKIAKLMHLNEGLCFVDYACSAPYVSINMHPKDTLEKLDAIYFSPHKFLGGPGSSGVLIFDSELYSNEVPDQPGGGTVVWTNPWGEHRYVEDVEAREDGGTPAILQTIKAALCVKLKEEMGTKNLLDREEEILVPLFEGLEKIKNLHILADNVKDRLGVVSFFIDDFHYNMFVKLLNDRFGIQVRGGCSCAGTYGHYLLHISRIYSNKITNIIDEGDLSLKPGWVRLSIHPVMTDEEIEYILHAISEIVKKGEKWSKDYIYNPKTNEYIIKRHKKQDLEMQMVKKWFSNI